LFFQDEGCEAEIKEVSEPFLREVPEELASKDFYGKVIECLGNTESRFTVRFTSTPPEVAAYVQALRQYGAKGMSAENL